MHCITDQRHRQNQNKFGKKVIQEVIAKIDDEAAAKNFLHVQCADSFQRNENHHDDEQPKAQPEKVDSEPVKHAASEIAQALLAKEGLSGAKVSRELIIQLCRA